MGKSNRMKKFGAFALVSCALMLVLAGCGTKTATPPAGGKEGQKQKISVAVINNFPPFEYKVEGKLVGFDIEMMEAIAKNQNLEIEWREMKFDGLIPALQAKQVDAAVSFIGVREDRAKVVDFSDSYFTSGYALVVRKDSPIQKVEDMKGKTVSVTQGTNGVPVGEKLVADHGAKMRILQSSDSLYLDVETGNSDAMVIDGPGVAYKIKVDGPNTKLRIAQDNLTKSDSAIAIVKGNKELVEKMNNGLKAIKENGEYQKIYDNYFAAK